VVNFVIDYQHTRQKSRKVLVNYPYTTTFRQHLGWSWFFLWVRVGNLFTYGIYCHHWVIHLYI